MACSVESGNAGKTFFHTSARREGGYAGRHRHLLLGSAYHIIRRELDLKLAVIKSDLNAINGRQQESGTMNK
jgi:hypothetical protein